MRIAPTQKSIAAGHAVVGWMLIQMAATAFPALDLPGALRGVILSLLLEFPLALFLGVIMESKLETCSTGTGAEIRQRLEIALV